MTAATRFDVIEMFIGTAAEMAAMAITGIPLGSRYFQSDTGYWYVLTTAVKNTGWTKELTPAS